jgi:hypothetical protein
MFGQLGKTENGKMVNVLAAHSSVPSGRILVAKYSLEFRLKVPASWILPSMKESIESFTANCTSKYPHYICPLTFDDLWNSSTGTNGCLLMKLKLTAPHAARLNQLLNLTEVLQAVRSGYEPLISFQNLVLDHYAKDPLTFATQNYLPIQGATNMVIWGYLQTTTSSFTSSNNSSSSSSSATVTNSAPTIVAFQPPIEMRYCAVRQPLRKQDGDAQGGAAGGSSSSAGGSSVPSHRGGGGSHGPLFGEDTNESTRG